CNTHGREGTLGSRDAAKLASYGTKHGIATGDFAAAAAFGEIVVLGVKGTGALSALSLAGDGNLAGQGVIHATTPIADEPPPKHGILRYFTGPDESLME